MVVGTELRRVFDGDALRIGFLVINCFNHFNQGVSGITMLLLQQRPQGFRDQQQPVNVVGEQFDPGLGFAGGGFAAIRRRMSTGAGVR